MPVRAIWNQQLRADRQREWHSDILLWLWAPNTYLMKLVQHFQLSEDQLLQLEQRESQLQLKVQDPKLSKLMLQLQRDLRRTSIQVHYKTMHKADGDWPLPSQDHLREEEQQGLHHVGGRQSSRESMRRSISFSLVSMSLSSQQWLSLINRDVHSWLRNTSQARMFHWHRKTIGVRFQAVWTTKIMNELLLKILKMQILNI